MLGADLFPCPWMALLPASFGVGLLCFFLVRGRPVLLMLLAALAGATNLALQTSILSPNDLRRLVGERIEDVTLRGTLCRTPTAKLQER